MSHLHPPLTFVCCVLLAFCCRAADEPRGQTAIEYSADTDLVLYGFETATHELVPGVDGQPASRIDVPAAGKVNWSVLHHSPVTTTAVHAGDRLVHSVTMRTVGDRTAIGDVAVFFESASPDKTGSVGGRVQPTPQLQTFRRSIVSPGDFDAAEMRLSIHLTTQTQILEFYGAKLEVFPADAATESLHLDGITWPGRSLSDPWRMAADERIDRLRKFDCSVRVISADGHPVPDAAVRFEQVNSSWKFGTFLGAKMLGDDEDAVRYRAAILRRFKSATLPAYPADWGWLNDVNRRQHFELAAWARQNQIAARGHLLVHPGWAMNPVGRVPEVFAATIKFMSRPVTILSSEVLNSAIKLSI